MIIILVTAEHTGRQLLAHVAHLTVNDQQCILLDLHLALENGNLLLCLIQILQNIVHHSLRIVPGGNHGPGLLKQFLNVLEHDVVADIVRQLINHAVGDTEHLRVNQIFKNGDGGTGNKAFFPVIQRRVTHRLVLNTGQQFCNLRFQGFIPGDGHICIRHHLQTLVRIVAVINFRGTPFHNRPEDIAVSGTRRQGGNLAVFPKNQRTGERHDKFFQLFVAVKHSVFFQRLPYDILVFQHPLLVLVAGFVTNR
ncbi:hypothetical protein BvCmsKSP054_00976 [Escherichia coli]|nr:hypothetical protein BvCmsKSP054_00976 [Escherichia coli]